MASAHTLPTTSTRQMEKVASKFTKDTEYRYEMVSEDMCKIMDQNDAHVAYALLLKQKASSTTVRGLRVEVPSLMRVYEKRLNPLVVWELDDSVAWVRADAVSGSLSIDPRIENYVLSVDPRKNPVTFII